MTLKRHAYQTKLNILKPVGLEIIYTFYSVTLKNRALPNGCYCDPIS